MATTASVTWHDPKVIHDILNLCGHEQVHICPACTKAAKDACPHRGNEPVGPCEGYAFAEQDAFVEMRVNEHLLANAERIFAKRQPELQS